jgi:hypothetical protein
MNMHGVVDQCTVLDVGCGGGSTFHLLVDSDAAVQEVNKAVPCYITIALNTSEMDCPKRCMFEVRNPFGDAEHLETCLIRALVRSEITPHSEMKLRELIALMPGFVRDRGAAQCQALSGLSGISSFERISSFEGNRIWRALAEEDGDVVTEMNCFECDCGQRPANWPVPARRAACCFASERHDCTRDWRMFPTQRNPVFREVAKALLLCCLRKKWPLPLRVVQSMLDFLLIAHWKQWEEDEEEEEEEEDEGADEYSIDSFPYPPTKKGEGVSLIDSDVIDGMIVFRDYDEAQEVPEEEVASDDDRDEDEQKQPVCDATSSVCEARYELLDLRREEIAFQIEQHRLRHTNAKLQKDLSIMCLLDASVVSLPNNARRAAVLAYYWPVYRLLVLSQGGHGSVRDAHLLNDCRKRQVQSPGKAAPQNSPLLPHDPDCLQCGGLPTGRCWKCMASQQDLRMNSTHELLMHERKCTALDAAMPRSPLKTLKLKENTELAVLIMAFVVDINAFFTAIEGHAGGDKAKVNT